MVQQARTCSQLVSIRTQVSPPKKISRRQRDCILTELKADSVDSGAAAREEETPDSAGMLVSYDDEPVGVVGSGWTAAKLATAMSAPGASAVAAASGGWASQLLWLPSAIPG